MKLRKILKMRLNENYTIDDFPIGTLITFKDKEEWIVVRPGLRAPNARKASNEITIKPHNSIAKRNNISLAIDVNIDYINNNILSSKPS